MIMNMNNVNINNNMNIPNRAESRDINSNQRIKGRNHHYDDLKQTIMREDLEWFNSDLSTQEISREIDIKIDYINDNANKHI